MELDDNIFKDETKAYYKDISIYNLHYPYGNKASVSYGLATDIDDFEIKHTCSTEHGSSGSPILNLSNNKVIGIHKQGSKKSNFNLGTCLKFPLNNFYKKRNSNKTSNMNNYNINVKYSIVNRKSIMIDLFNDMKNIRKPGRPKMNIIFKNDRGKDVSTIIVSHGTKIDQVLKYYLRRMNRPEFIGSPKILFFHNATTIGFGNKTPVEIYFRNEVNPTVIVNFNSSINEHSFYGNWCNWTKGEEEEIKKEENRLRDLESNFKTDVTQNSPFFLGNNINPIFSYTQNYPFFGMTQNNGNEITVRFNKRNSIIKIKLSNECMVAELINEYFIKTKTNGGIFKFNGQTLSCAETSSLYEVGLKDNSEIIVI